MDLGAICWLGRGDSNLRMAESNALPFHLATPHHTACLRRHGARTIAAASTWRAFHRLGLLLRASARDCCSISQHLQLAGTSLEVDVIDHNGARVCAVLPLAILTFCPFGSARLMRWISARSVTGLCRVGLDGPDLPGPGLRDFGLLFRMRGTGVKIPHARFTIALASCSERFPASSLAANVSSLFRFCGDRYRPALQRQEAERAAWAAPGVAKVDNRIVVSR
jgi:hypothetical protein